MTDGGFTTSGALTEKRRGLAWKESVRAISSVWRGDSDQQNSFFFSLQVSERAVSCRCSPSAELGMFAVMKHPDAKIHHCSTLLHVCCLFLSSSPVRQWEVTTAVRRQARASAPVGAATLSLGRVCSTVCPSTHNTLCLHKQATTTAQDTQLWVELLPLIFTFLSTCWHFFFLYWANTVSGLKGVCSHAHLPACYLASGCEVSHRKWRKDYQRISVTVSELETNWPIVCTAEWDCEALYWRWNKTIVKYHLLILQKTRERISLNFNINRRD